MGSFGEKLRREREMRKISLDEIAAATKIGTRSLKALEEENFSILPGGIFNKGFVRSYARFLGMNEEEAVADYQAAAKEQPVSVKTIAAQSAIAKANRLAAQQASESSSMAGLVRAAVMILVIVALAFGGYKAFRKGYFKALKRPSLHRQMKQAAVVPTQTAPASPSSSAVDSNHSATTPAVSAAAPMPTTTPAPVVSAAGPAAAATPNASASTGVGTTQADAEFTVRIKTSAESWLSVTADGRRAFQRLFAPNEEQAVTAKSKVRITIGNPGGTELSLNGRPLVIGGDLGRPRTVTVDATGLESE